MPGRKKKTDPAGPRKPWGTDTRELPAYVMDNLYEVYRFLDRDVRTRLGLMLKAPVFIKDPAVALDSPTLGIQEIAVRLENGFAAGPTSSRLAVVDFNADTQRLTPPVQWDGARGWFRMPPGGEWLPDAPPDLADVKDRSRYQDTYRDYIDAAVRNPYFRQVNAWATVQRVLEFYEEPQALGRPIPWGFEGNRLIVVPQAGYGENAFYDRGSKSLQFYYFGDRQSPSYTCLSHDIVAHETGHAVLDGIRPLYFRNSSVQTGAFHEFIGDLTAIVLALFNNDIRWSVAEKTGGDVSQADVLADLARQFGEEVEGRQYLRTARNGYTLADDAIARSLSPHTVSQVLTGAVFDILVGIAHKYLTRHEQQAAPAADTHATASPGAGPTAKKVTPARALWWAAEAIRRVALQPLDLCPPCDIQFLDYARAVLHNDVMNVPVDEDGFRRVMLDVFHARKLCACAYSSGSSLPADCLLAQALTMPDVDFVYHDINRLSSSRAAAYNFLSDNRKVLRIPPHQDIIVVDLYDNAKLGAGATRLPRQIVLEYVWREEMVLQNDPAGNLTFGALAGKTVSLDCGGTLVFDERGNLLSWMRKPGTEHISAERAAELMRERQAVAADPLAAAKQGIRFTRQERGELDDYEEGLRRKAALRSYMAAVVRRGMVAEPQAARPPLHGYSLKPLAAIEEDGVVRLEMSAHLRDRDFDTEAEAWTINF